MNKITFRKGYFLMAIFLLIVEVVIALFVRDSFLRPYGGDFLVIFFLYCLLRSFFRIPVKNAIFRVLFFAFVLEGFQYIKIVELLHLQDDIVVSTVLGTHFEWLDLLIYVLAAVFLFAAESFLSRRTTCIP